MLAPWKHPSGRGLLLLAGLWLALILPRLLGASVVVPATLDELAGEADLIVHARVARVDTRQAPRTLRVERVVVLEIMRALKGSPEQTVVGRPAGRHLGATRTVVPASPTWRRATRWSCSCAPRRAPGRSWSASRRVSSAFASIRRPGERTVGAPAAAGIDGPVVRGATDRGPQPLARIEARIARVVLAQVRGRR